MVKQGGTLKGVRTATFPCRHMAVAIAAPTPVVNVWQVAFTGANVRLLMTQFRMSTAAEDLEFRIVADGVTHDGAQAGAVAGTWYFAHLNPDADTLLMGGPASFLWQTANSELGWDCRNVVVSMRKTTANGANVLTARIHYEQY